MSAPGGPASALCAAKIIGGKTVYVVESHHHVLLPWSIERRKLSAAPALIAFDYHADTRPAFLHHAFAAAGQDEAKIAALRREMLAAAGWRDAAALSAAINKLSNDEHIDYAVRTGLVSNAFVFTFEASSTWSVQERAYWTDDSPRGAARRAKCPPPLPPYNYQPSLL